MVGHWVTFFQPVLESFPGGCQNLIQFFYRYILIKKCFLLTKMKRFLKSSDIEHKTFGRFVENVSAGLSNLHFHVQGNHLMKSNFFERNVILSFSDIEQKISCALSEVSPRDLQNCILFVFRNILMKRGFFSEKYEFFPTNDRHWAKHFGVWSNFFRQCVKPAFYVSIGTFWWREVFFWKNIYVFSSFSDLECIFLTCCWKELKGFVKTAFKPSIAVFDQIILLIKTVLYPFLPLSKKFLIFSSKFFSWVFETAF